MRNVLFFFFLPLTMLGQDLRTPESTFQAFRTALLHDDCPGLADLSQLPIGGDAGLARLLSKNSEAMLSEEMNARNYEISQELLLANCHLLESPELEVLELFDPAATSDTPGVMHEGCSYTAHMRLADDGASFQWSVGCAELSEEAIGEYSIVFTFRKIAGEYRLTMIHGVG